MNFDFGFVTFTLNLPQIYTAFAVLLIVLIALLAVLVVKASSANRALQHIELLLRDSGSEKL